MTWPTAITICVCVGLVCVYTYLCLDLYFANLRGQRELERQKLRSQDPLE